MTDKEIRILLDDEETHKAALSVFEGFDDRNNFIKAKPKNYVESGAKAQALKIADELDKRPTLLSVFIKRLREECE